MDSSNYGNSVTCLLSVGMSIYNIADGHMKGTLKQASMRESVSNWESALFVSHTLSPSPSQTSPAEMLRPLFCPTVLFGVSVLWGAYSPSKILDAHARMFFFTMGTVFSNIAVSLFFSSRAYRVLSVSSDHQSNVIYSCSHLQWTSLSIHSLSYFICVSWDFLRLDNFLFVIHSSLSFPVWSFPSSRDTFSSDYLSSSWQLICITEPA